MRIRWAAAVALVVLAPPAHAAPSAVHGSITAVGQYFGDSAFTAVVCNAIAVPGAVEDVPVSTSLRCDADGVTYTAVSPGAVTATAFVAVTTEYYEICVTSDATFLDRTTNRFYSVHENAVCDTP
jgi:hypothetical protein